MPNMEMGIPGRFIDMNGSKRGWNVVEDLEFCSRVTVLRPNCCMLASISQGYVAGVRFPLSRGGYDRKSTIEWWRLGYRRI